MRDNRIDLTPLKGLRPQKTGWNDMFLSSAQGVSVHEGGLKVYIPPSQVKSFSASFPFPQVMDCHDGAHLLFNGSIYRLMSIGPAQRYSNIPTDGYPWSFAEIGEFVLMSNFKTVMQLSSGALSINEDVNVPVFRSIVNFKDQFVVGNVWAYGEHRPSLVMWAVPGSAFFKPGQSSAGGIFCTGIGEILNMKIISRTNYTNEILFYIIVYGTEGVGVLSAHDFPATFGFKKLDGLPGMASQLAVAGDEHFHAYVGKDKTLWFISADQTIPVGYNEFLASGEEFVLTYNTTKGELYVSF